MKVLVTGASGYLGQHVLKALEARGVAPVGIGHYGGKCDLTDAIWVRLMLIIVAPSAIIHCAAIVPKTAEGYHDEQAAALSVLMMQNLATHAECPIVFASSMTAEEPRTAYARGKRAAEEALTARQHHGDVIVRLPGLFGPPRTSGVIYEAEQAIARGEVPNVPVLDWIVANVRDAAEYLVAMAVGEKPPGVRLTSGHAVISDLQRARTG